MLLCLLGAAQCAFAENRATQSQVASIEVQLEINPSMYEGLQERIEFTIGRVGEKILLDQPLYLLEKEQAQVTASMKKVFAAALKGFSIEKFELALAEHTKISMELIPQSPFLSAVKSKFEFRGISDDMQPFLLPIGESLSEELQQIFIGLPVDSLEWSNGILETVAGYIVERDFPGFSLGSLEKNVIDTETLELSFTLKPTTKVVQNVKWRYVSRTIPIWIVRSMLREDENSLECLKGLPIEFVVHYQEKLESFLLSSFSKVSRLKQMDVLLQPKISSGQQTEIILNVDSLHWRTAVEGRIYLGDGDYHYSSVRVGYETSDCELYLQKNFGDHPELDVIGGVKIPLSSNFLAGFEYELKNNQKSIDFYYDFERGDYFFLKVGIDDAPNEACIGIRISSRANLELVSYEKKYGINLMIHLW